MKILSNNFKGNSMKKDNVKFEVQPLDLNIVKMQCNMLSRCEREVPENGDFAPVFETFKNQSPLLENLAEIKILCENDKEDTDKKRTGRVLRAIITKRNPKDNLDIELFKGNKSELLEYLNTREIFDVCKPNAVSP